MIDLDILLRAMWHVMSDEEKREYVEAHNKRMARIKKREKFVTIFICILYFAVVVFPPVLKLFMPDAPYSWYKAFIPVSAVGIIIGIMICSALFVQWRSK